MILLASIILTFAHLRNRSIPGRVVQWFRGESGSEQYLDDLVEDTKKAVDPTELQQWAVRVLQETSQSESRMVKKEDIPSSVRNLKTNGLHFEMVTCDSDAPAPSSERSICIWWGGGFFHWGIRVGSPTFKITPTSTSTTYVEWRPGIYFWRETQ